MTQAEIRHHLSETIITREPMEILVDGDMCLLSIPEVSLVLPVVTARAQNVKRVLIADRDTWESSSTFFLHGSESAECHQDAGCGENGSISAGGHSQSGIRRENTEQVKNLNKACPDIGITVRRVR